MDTAARCGARHAAWAASGGDFLDGLVDEIADADLTAVIDAVGCDQVAIVGPAHGGPAAIRYAATHPGRVRALVLINTYAHYLQTDDYPWGVPPAAMDRYMASAAERLGHWSRARSDRTEQMG